MRSLVGALLIWLLVAGCESNKTSATAETPSSKAVPKLRPDTLAATHISAADTFAESAQASPLEDVPALHIPFEERRTVAPGLVVIIKSIQQPATAVIHDPWDIKATFSILQKGRVIYRDTANGMTYDFSEQPEIRKRYPIWIPTGQTDGELLVAFDNRPSKELARRYFIQNNRVTRIDTILTFNGPAKNYDQDAELEFAGFYGYGEEWDDEKGQHRMMYVPTLYYKVRPTGLVFDSVLTKRKVLAEYGVFQGFKDKGQPGIAVKDLPKGSSKRH
ncbi:hypothetical protein [Hymenobacter negativus]|uniref:Uncharacterized protein n=1 Tax=Hymenobacter negativus TaxID=2795026 RepID=A0ABS3QKP4_9BACT|nr:hypothetical protein [Hymenobacter negativus]MBO2011839.1 hypothetical protein [Hymenobacter negativus]